ncbi:hypothetical protein BC749_10165 [Flavobacterium araucananum]|nr:hypothetical protein BC749_10165 [Flavobacterium araucananum]
MADNICLKFKIGLFLFLIAPQSKSGDQKQLKST